MRDNWSETSIGDLVSQVKDPVKVLPGVSYKLLGVRWYGNGPFIREEVTSSTSKATRLFPVHKGDFIYNRLFAWKGSFGLITDDFEGCYVSSEFPLFQVNPELLDANLLNFIMCQPKKWAQIEIESTGSTSVSRNRWKEDRFLEQRFLLPPLSEQKRIVDLVSSVDAYIGALQQQVEASRTARDSLLHELLFPFDNDWIQTTIGEVSRFITTRQLPENLNTNIPYIGLEHLDPKTSNIARSGEITSVSSNVTPFERQDVLFGRLRPYLHKVAIADTAGVCSPEILVLRSDSSCLPEFLHLLCSANSTIKACVEMSAGTRMPRTSTTDLATIPVSLPPLSEQQRIVDIISSMNDVIRATEECSEVAIEFRSGLLSDLLSGNHEIPESYDSFLEAV